MGLSFQHYRLGLTCSGAVTEVSHLYPAYHRRRRLCCLQKETLLFSCAGGGPGLRRLCPCRAYQPGQVALCQGCL
ncbi:MGT5B acetylglucosaminyltransferase, partial [Amia calva]|nr:MGT5B acetylglucosaminyltransferase [Amia calva]